MTLNIRILAAASMAAALAVQAPTPAAAQAVEVTSATRTTMPAAAPAAGSVEEALLRASFGGRLSGFYAARQGRPIWSTAGGPASPEALFERLDAADTHALPALSYGGPSLRDRARSAEALEPEAQAALELDLSRALVAYATDLSAGVVRPNQADPQIHVFPDRPDPETLLTTAAASADLGGWLDSLAPDDRDYEALRDVYARLKREAGSGGWRATLSDGGTLRPGDEGPRVVQLRARLAELGNPPPPTSAPHRYDADLEQAVRAFQTRHGLTVDGLVGPRTFSTLGADVGERLQQVAVNLERLRWAQRDPYGRHIVVNQAEYMMRLYDHGDLIHQAKVVIGTRRHQTPEFTDEMDHLVVNPTWHVPRSIATEEILPSLRNDPSYLARSNMRLVATDGGPVPVDATTHDWSQYSKAFFPYSVKQGPGDGNSLGRVKFMFPNQFSIYLHDTPSKNLFSRDQRSFSHGCVRVQDPFELAYILLAPQLSDPEGRFQSWLSTGREIYVNLEQPVKVYLTYRTAWVDETGEVQFRQDIYGRDEAVWAALEAEGLGAGI